MVRQERKVFRSLIYVMTLEKTSQDQPSTRVALDKACSPQWSVRVVTTVRFIEVEVCDRRPGSDSF
jgi:hypothetical protein